jgi:5-methylcytosine-specific restriction endonuclease McrA
MPYKDPEAKRAQSRAWAKAKRLRWTEEERDKRLAYNRAYYAAHKAELAEKARVYNAARKEEMNATSRAYYAAHKKEINARSRAYKTANKEALAAKKRTYDAAHKVELAVKYRAYRLAHPEIVAANQARHWARQAGASVNDLTAAQWEEIKAAYGHRCVYCGRTMQRLTKDHIVPLAKGGTHTFSNIVPACQSCNSKKGAGAPLVPVQPLLLTLAASRKD